jgi:hypothetical protein
MMFAEAPQTTLAGPGAMRGPSGIPPASCGLPTTGMAAWYKADAGVTCTGGCTNGATVTAWADQSGNGNNLTTTGSVLTYSTGAINGLPAINFPSIGSGFPTGNSFTFTTPLNLATSTIFVTLQMTTNAYKMTLISGLTNSMTYFFKGNAGGGTEQGSDKTFVSNLINGTAAPDTNWHQMNLTLVASTSQALRLGRASDGTNTSTTTVTGNETLIGYNAQSGANSCTLPNPCEEFTGNVQEIIIYTSAISVTTDENYINCRTGL